MVCVSLACVSSCVGCSGSGISCNGEWIALPTLQHATSAWHCTALLLQGSVWSSHHPPLLPQTTLQLHTTRRRLQLPSATLFGWRGRKGSCKLLAFLQIFWTPAGYNAIMDEFKTKLYLHLTVDSIWTQVAIRQCELYWFYYKNKGSLHP